MSAVWLASPEEVEDVARLLVEFRNHLGHSWPPADSFITSVGQLIDGPDTEFLLAASDKDALPAGICQLRFRHSVWTAAEDCWLEDLFVLREVRRRGLARALVERALERAREHGSRRVELDTNEDNHGAIRLYERLGFSPMSKGSSRSLFLGVRLGR
ncbi:MAG: GNAT family N-acetyltransferase [Solirubrobacteraceae bacterium]